VTAASDASPMTSVLARGLVPTLDGHATFGPGYPDCALACSRDREPGLRDGGFVNVMGELGVELTPRHWESVAACAAPPRRRGVPGLSRARRVARGLGALEHPAHRRVRDLPRRARALRSRAGLARDAHGARRSRRARRDGRRVPRVATPTWGFLARVTGDAATVDRPPACGRRARRRDVRGLPRGCTSNGALRARRGAHARSPALRAAGPRCSRTAALPAPAQKSQVCLGCHRRTWARRAHGLGAALWLRSRRGKAGVREQRGPRTERRRASVGPRRARARRARAPRGRPRTSRRRARRPQAGGGRRSPPSPVTRARKPQVVLATRARAVRRGARVAIGARHARPRARPARDRSARARRGRSRTRRCAGCSSAPRLGQRAGPVTGQAPPRRRGGAAHAARSPSGAALSSTPSSPMTFTKPPSRSPGSPSRDRRSAQSG